MKLSRRSRRLVVFVIAFAAGLWAADWMFRGESLAIADTTTAPATRPALAPAVRQVVDRIQAAYAKRPISIHGSITIDFDVAGIKEQRTTAVRGAAESAVRFSHEVDGEVRIVSNEKTLNILDVKRSEYLATRREDGAQAAASTRMVSAMLREQNPALLVAISDDVGAALFGEGDVVSLGEPSGEVDVVRVESEGVVRNIFVTKDGLIDRVEMDFRPRLEAEGAREVNRAAGIVRYDSSTNDAPLDPAAFEFKPPADAVEAPSGDVELMSDVRDANTMVGKPAPAFELADLAGAKVSSTELKGKIIVIDFWASWCGPCRETLPDVDALAAMFAGKGVATYAINVGEDAAAVRTFLQEQSLGVTALLDSDSAVAKRFGVSGIPHTVVIGRDGKVRYVHVGAADDFKSELQSQIEAALKP